MLTVIQYFLRFFAGDSLTGELARELAGELPYPDDPTDMGELARELAGERPFSDEFSTGA